VNTTNQPTIDEREWEAQECGMRAAAGAGPDSMDPAAATYRVVAEALATLPRSEPPADFAACVARQVALSDAGLERPLSRILLVVFVMALAVVGILFGQPAWQLLREALDSDALGWLLAGASCLALSWMGGRAVEFSSHAGGPGRHA
jgi:hypothetical protein